MKIMVMSDVHLGDKDSMFNEGRVEQTFRNLFESQPETIPHCDILILNGDILDFAINSFRDGYMAAKSFFQYLYEKDFTRCILYIPGNHDRQVWDALQWEVNVMQPIEKKEDPRELNQINPAFIDFRENGVIHFPLMKHRPTFRLFDDPNTGELSDLGNDKVGNVFLRGLIDFGDNPHDFKIMVAYPMVFINQNATAKQLHPDDLLMIAHGQHLESGWVLITELLNGYTFPAQPDLDWNTDVAFSDFTLEQLEQYNYFITSLIGTDCGQTGEVSRLVYAIERMVRSPYPKEQKHFRNEFKKLTKVFNNNVLRLFLPYKKGLNLANPFKTFPERTGTLFALNKLEKELVPNPKDEAEKDYAKWIHDPNRHTKRFFEAFMRACCDAKKRLCDDTGLVPGLPDIPGNIIFGHTHVCVRDISQSVVTYSNTLVKLYNTGAWLQKEGCDGVIFQIDENGIDDSLYQKYKSI